MMNALRALAASVVLALCLASPAPAQGTPPPAADEQQPIDPARLAAARDVLIASKVEENLTKMLPAMFDQMTAALVEHFAAGLPDDAARDRFRKASAVIIGATQRQFVERRGEVLDIVAQVYARTFTVEEMNAISGFLRSPVGTRFVDSTPGLQQKVTELFTNLAIGKPLPKPADTDPAKLDAARQMFAASKLDATLDAMFNSLPPTAGSGDNAFLNTLKSRRGEMVDVLAATYAETFTVEEMNEVTAFYTSPQGVKLIEALPAMLRETSRATTEFARRFAADLSKQITEELRKIQP